MDRAIAASLAVLLTATAVQAGGFTTKAGMVACPTLSQFEAAVTAATHQDERGWNHAMTSGCRLLTEGEPASILREPRVGIWVRVRVYSDPPQELYTFRSALRADPEPEAMTP